MNIFIADTNIFLDIMKMGILPDFFALDAVFYTTQFVTAEIKHESQKKEIDAFVRSRHLTVLELSGEEIEQMYQWETVPYLKRIADRSVVWKARQLDGAIMLTGDIKMKKVALANAIKNHGIIWVIDYMAKEGIITETTAKSLHEEVKKINKWLQ
jgi:rRNA-processing protein FCF1